MPGDKDFLSKKEENFDWDTLYGKYSKLNEKADELNKKLDKKINRDIQLSDRFDVFFKLEGEITEQINDISGRLEIYRNNPEKQGTKEFKVLEESEKKLNIKWEKVAHVIDLIFSTGDINSQESHDLLKEMEEIRILQSEMETTLGFL